MEGEPGKRGGVPDQSRELGLTVQDITPEIAQRFEIENTKGVLVTGVEGGSPAEDAGFQEGDIVRQINRQPVPNVAEFAKLVKQFKGDKTVLFLVERGESRLFLAVKNK
jgi:serine protease Do